MKKKILLFVITALSFACKKETVDPVTTTSTELTSANLVKNITVGTWTVSSFMELTEDKSKNFAKITFTFTSDGKVTVNDNGKTFNGTWSNGGTVYYGQPIGLKEREVSFSLGSSTPYDKLSKSWIISGIKSNSLTFDSANPTEGRSFSLSK
jgi:hypothetical protein